MELKDKKSEPLWKSFEISLEILLKIKQTIKTRIEDSTDG